MAIAVLAALFACVLLPAAALADGDPGSDVLLDQNLFAGWDANLTAVQQLQLGKLLNATAQAGAPVRVAIIAQRDDLGTVTALWLQPQAYAKYLGYELSLAYAGRLIVVMPNGYGVYWHANPAGEAKLARVLAGQHPASDSAASLTAGTISVVNKIEWAAGVSAAKLSHGSSPTTPVPQAPASGPAPKTSSGSATTAKAAHSSSLLVIVTMLLIAALAVYIAVRSDRLRRLRLRLRRPEAAKAGGAERRLRLTPLMALPVCLVAVVLLALVINQAGSTPPAALSGDTLATNPDLDPGTPLHGLTAPPFTLVDESGQRVSLSSTAARS